MPNLHVNIIERNGRSNTNFLRDWKTHLILKVFLMRTHAVLVAEAGRRVPSLSRSKRRWPPLRGKCGLLGRAVCRTPWGGSHLVIRFYFASRQLNMFQCTPSHALNPEAISPPSDIGSSQESIQWGWLREL